MKLVKSSVLSIYSTFSVQYSRQLFYVFTALLPLLSLNVYENFIYQSTPVQLLALQSLGSLKSYKSFQCFRIPNSYFWSWVWALVSTHSVWAPSLLIRHHQSKAGVLCGTNHILSPMVRDFKWKKFIHFYLHLKCHHLEWNHSWDRIQPFSHKPWWSCSKPSLPWSHTAPEEAQSFLCRTTGGN